MQSSGSQNICWDVTVENIRGTEEAIEKLKNCIPSSIKLYIGNLEVKRGKLSRTGLRHTVTFYVLGPDLHEREIHEWFLSAGLVSWSISAVERPVN